MPSRNPALHFAITSHGLGHLTRTVAVIREIHVLRPDLELHLSTTVEERWIQSQLDFEVHCRPRAYEPGALQRNCFEVDIEATQRAYRTFVGQHSTHLGEEVEFLGTHEFVGVISDISALAIRAAADCDLPAIGISNFTWDWILEPWCAGHEDPAVRDLPGQLADDYSSGSTLLRLPYGPDVSPFPTLEKVPLVARRSTRSRAEVRAAIGVGDGPLAAVCPGGWSADEWPHIHATPGDFTLVTVGDLPITCDSPLIALGRELPGKLTFPDLVEAADVVVGKPGYGLASECATHHTPFAMIERPEFRETPYLIAEFEANGRCSTSTIEQFFSGDWEPILNGAGIGGVEWTSQPSDAARQVAARAIEALLL